MLTVAFLPNLKCPVNIGTKLIAGFLSRVWADHRGVLGSL